MLIDWLTYIISRAYRDAKDNYVLKLDACVTRVCCKTDPILTQYTIHYDTIQYNTRQCMYILQYNIIHCNINTIQYNTNRYTTIWHNPVPLYDISCKMYLVYNVQCTRYDVMSKCIIFCIFVFVFEFGRTCVVVYVCTCVCVPGREMIFVTSITNSAYDHSGMCIKMFVYNHCKWEEQLCIWHPWNWKCICVRKIMCTQMLYQIFVSTNWHRLPALVLLVFIVRGWCTKVRGWCIEIGWR